MDFLSLEFIIGIAVGLGINLASALYIEQLPQPVRQVAGLWLVRATLIGAMVVGSSFAVITGWAWCVPPLAILCQWGFSLLHRQEMARRYPDPFPVCAERSRRQRQGLAVELALVGIFAAGLSALICHIVDREIATALQAGDSIGVWVWAIMLVPFSVLLGQIAVFLAWYIGCSVELRRIFLH
jgi:hypothetical protein